MAHQIFNVEGNVVVFSMSAVGPLRVYLNGKTVDKKILYNFPISYQMNIISNDPNDAEILLLVKMDDNTGEILLDFFRGKRKIESNVKLKKGMFINKFKKEGLAKLAEFELEEALELLEKGIELVPYDNEIYFHIACIYSIQENTNEAIKYLESAIFYGYKDYTSIKTNDKLAFVRIQEEFEGLLQKNIVIS